MVQLMQLMQQGATVAAVAGDATGGLYKKPRCTHAPQPRNATRKSKTRSPSEPQRGRGVKSLVLPPCGDRCPFRELFAPPIENRF
jgi:hypothetical protein